MSAIIPTDLAEKIKARITVNDSGCWVYPTTAADGYARVTVKSDSTKSGYTTVRPSRVMYEAEVGPIPDGLELDHVKSRGCTSTACCWPGHLEPVTGRENKLRGDGPPAQNLAKVQCPAGHDYDEENTYFYPNGSRGCRLCNARQQRELRRSRGEVGPQNADKTHCKKNHEYTPENTKMTLDGARVCLTCRKGWDRARSRQKRNLEITA